MEHLKNKKILVTGGAGSIGSCIIDKLFAFDVDVVRVLDNNETALFYLGEKHHDKNIRLLIGDIRDKDRLYPALEDIDVVFHCAALKHVPLCEYNPFEAVKTNVMGTNNLIEVAFNQNIDLFVNVSTDKAVNPITVMGSTKLLNERMVASAHTRRANKKTRFCSVRFGNVRYSRGSMYPVFMSQIKEKGCINVTDMKMKRFMMDIDEAVSLLLKASMYCKGGEVFILKMSEYSIGDIASRLSLEYNVPIKIIGKRGPEKIKEELLTDEERKIMLEEDDMFIVPPIKAVHGGLI